MRYIFLTLVILLTSMLNAQTPQHYRLPPAEILGLADIKPRPLIRIDSRNSVMVMLERQAFRTLEEMAEEEIRLAGLRINPRTNGPARVTYTYGLRVIRMASGEALPINGLPEVLKISDFSFSPDERKFAFSNTLPNGIELWVVSLETGTAQRVTDPVLNGALGFPYRWMPDSESLLVKVIPGSREDTGKTLQLPDGPAVQETSGRKAPARTFQDLLRSPADEREFEHYVMAEIVKAGLDGETTAYLPAAIYRSMDFSPDGRYLMVQTLTRPYSYLVPFYRFPVDYSLYRADGSFYMTFHQKPLLEELPAGFDATETGKRSIGWRSDKPASLYWAEAADGGDPEKESLVRDNVYTLDEPFRGEGQLLASLPLRFRSVDWGNDDLALVTEGWWRTRKETTYLVNPSNTRIEKKVLFERSTEDAYNDPGNFLVKRNQFNSYSLWFSDDGKKLYLQGEGYSPEGNRPFLDEIELKSLKKKRLWQADGISTYESIVRVIDPGKRKMLTSIESMTINPNFFIRTGKSLRQLTYFPNPYESFMNVSKERVRYKRADGVELSATLYLPAGYVKERDGALPMLMWAYPREFKDAGQAGQVRESPHTFVQLYYGSPVYWAARGYAILDDADFPIIGEGEEQPNDSFVEQLVANAAAAIDYCASRGVADPGRVAIGGHSYGAFMTANLMAHCDLFAAGIARSGAYNRTLTPFGFQAEERTFWEAPEVYMKMSPFVHADKINEPLLLIHGDADNNSGTFTLQSERLFGAIKGLGGTARLVLLPYESHGYSARENVLHMLWETDEWLEKYVKNKGK